jgi:hypothetical protein
VCTFLFGTVASNGNNTSKEVGKPCSTSVPVHDDDSFATLLGINSSFRLFYLGSFGRMWRGSSSGFALRFGVILSPLPLLSLPGIDW